MTIKTIKIVAHIQTLWAARFVPHRQTVRATAYRLAREMGIQNNFNVETETAGYDRWIFFFRRNTDMSVRHAEALPLARTRRMNRKSVRNIF